MSAHLFHDAASMWKQKAIEWLDIAHQHEMAGDMGNAMDCFWFACYCEEQAGHMMEDTQP